MANSKPYLNIRFVFKSNSRGLLQHMQYIGRLGLVRGKPEKKKHIFFWLRWAVDLGVDHKVYAVSLLNRQSWCKCFLSDNDIIHKQ